MKKYVSRYWVYGEWSKGDTSLYLSDVIIEDKVPKFSGLLDASGNRLYVEEDTHPVGFIHHKR